MPVVYITPSTTIGVASRPRSVAVSNDHASPSLRGIGVVDLIERAEALLVVVAPIGEPVTAARLDACQCLVVDRGGSLLGGNQADEEENQRSACEQPASHMGTSGQIVEPFGGPAQDV